MKVFTLIPSGGIGSRTSESIPKQYLKFSGKEMIAYTLEVFQNCNLVDCIVIAAQEEYFQLLSEIKSKYNFSKITHFIKGGSTRQESVHNALMSIKAEDQDLVIVHDAARPLLQSELLMKSINVAKNFDNAVVAIKAKDTLSSGRNKIEKYLDRENINYIQTPQIFRFIDLYAAFELALKDGFKATDESMLIHHTGKKINLVEGSSWNFKITTDEDIRLFRLIAEKLFESKNQNI